MNSQSNPYHSIALMVKQNSEKHLKLARTLLAPLTSQFGIDYFCYQFVGHDGRWYTLGSDPDWLHHCAEQEFYRYDPTLVDPKNYFSNGVFLPQYHDNTHFQETLIADAQEGFDIHHPLAIIQPVHDGCEFFFFCAPKKNRAAPQHYLKHLKLLQHDYLDFVQQKLQSCQASLREAAVNLNAINIENFQRATNIFSIESDITLEQNFLADLGKRPHLSKRESQCLNLYQQGLTAKQTGRQLNISPRTVEGYFEILKEKYAVRRKQDLLSKVFTPPRD